MVNVQAGKAARFVKIHVVIPTRWEKRVVARIRRGDRDALGELFDQFSASVFGFAHRITADRLVAETITRAVFLNVWHNPRRLAEAPDGVGLREWLAELARVAAVQWRSDHAGASQQPDVSFCTVSAEPKCPDAKESARANASRSWAVESLDALPAENRALVEAVLFDGQPLTQVAAAQGLGPSVAARRLGEALLRISTRVSTR